MFGVALVLATCSLMSGKADHVFVRDKTVEAVRALQSGDIVTAKLCSADVARYLMWRLGAVPTPPVSYRIWQLMEVIRNTIVPTTGQLIKSGS